MWREGPGGYKFKGVLVDFPGEADRPLMLSPKASGLKP